MDKGNGYAYIGDRGNSKELDELKLRYLKEVMYYSRRGCHMAPGEYKIIYGNK